MPDPKESDFPAATKFWVKGFDVPVAWAPPDGVAASWFAGKPTPWDKEYLEFALSKSNEGLDEISFAEFAKLVAESME